MYTCIAKHVHTHKHTHTRPTSLIFQENENQNQNEMSLHWNEDGYYQNIHKTTNVGMAVETREFSYNDNENINWYSRYEKWLSGFSKTKHSTTIWSSNPTIIHISKGNDINMSKNYLNFRNYCSIIWLLFTVRNK